MPALTGNRINGEQRIYGRGSDFACVRVDPKNRDVLYVANTSTYRSDDAGQSFTAIKGAPGGDDYHTIWINPLNPNIILLAADQGATISVNHGRTWSSWYNQPTAQFYHVITDNQTPYWVYGGQQESGSVGIASRGNDGQISFREWHPSAPRNTTTLRQIARPEYRLWQPRHEVQPGHGRSGACQPAR